MQFHKVINLLPSVRGQRLTVCKHGNTVDHGKKAPGHLHIAPDQLCYIVLPLYHRTIGVIPFPGLQILQPFFHISFVFGLQISICQGNQKIQTVHPDIFFQRQSGIGGQVLLIWQIPHNPAVLPPVLQKLSGHCFFCHQPGVPTFSQKLCGQVIRPTIHYIIRKH